MAVEERDGFRPDPRQQWTKETGGTTIYWRHGLLCVTERSQMAGRIRAHGDNIRYCLFQPISGSYCLAQIHKLQFPIQDSSRGDLRVMSVFTPVRFPCNSDEYWAFEKYSWAMSRIGSLIASIYYWAFNNQSYSFQFSGHVKNQMMVHWQSNRLNRLLKFL